MKDNYSLKCQIKKGWMNAGKEGQYFGEFKIKGRIWAIVLWNNSDEPDLYKIESLEIENEIRTTK